MESKVAPTVYEQGSLAAADPNGTKLSRIFDADGICASWGQVGMALS